MSHILKGEHDLATELATDLVIVSTDNWCGYGKIMVRYSQSYNSHCRQILDCNDTERGGDLFAHCSYKKII